MTGKWFDIGCASAVIVSCGGYLTGSVIMTDSVQKLALKRNLLSNKFVAKSEENRKANKYSLNRKKECIEIEAMIPKTPTTKNWRIVANPRGIGKSWLMREWAARRTEFIDISESKKAGPVLYSDLSDIYTDEELTNLLVATINPFFMKFRFLRAFCYMVDLKMTDRDKLRLFQMVAEELAEEERPVVWIMDSIDSLVTNGLRDKYNSVDLRRQVWRLFSMNKYLIPLPVSSSTTLYKELFALSSDIAQRTGWYYPYFESEEDDLVKFLESLLGKNVSMVEDADIRETVKFFGDNLLAYDEMSMMSTGKSFSFKDVVDNLKVQHKNVVLQSLHLDKSPHKMTIAELKECNKRCDLFMRIKENQAVYSRDVPADMMGLVEGFCKVQQLLRRHHGFVKFVMPGTGEILTDEDVVSKMVLVKELLASSDNGKRK